MRMVRPVEPSSEQVTTLAGLFAHEYGGCACVGAIRLDNTPVVVDRQAA
jgi:hypothetical protein